MVQEKLTTYKTAQEWLAAAAKRRDPKTPQRIQSADNPMDRLFGFVDTQDDTVHVISLTDLKNTYQSLTSEERDALREPATRLLLLQQGQV